MDDMNPGTFDFGPVWWAVFLLVVALVIFALMGLMLWQARRERPARAGHQLRHGRGDPDQPTPSREERRRHRDSGRRS